MPRRLVIMMCVGLTVAITVGIVLLARGSTAEGLFFLVGFPVVNGVNALLMRRSAAERRPGAPPRRGTETGRQLRPVPTPAQTSAERAWSQTGGANVVTEFGRLNATWPLAVLAVKDGRLVLRVRPRLIGRFLRSEPLAWGPIELSRVYPVRGRLIGLNRGVAVEPKSAPIAYFWTKNPELTLTALAAHGIPVDWQERTIRLWR